MPPRNRNRYRNKRRRPRKQRVPRKLVNLGTHYFRRTATLTPLTAASTNAEIVFKFIDIPNETEFTNLFDQYMITKIVLKFMPEQNVSDVTNGIGARVPTIRCASDPDGGSGTSFEALGEMKHVDLYLNRPRTYTIYNPSVATSVYESAIATAYGPKKKRWIDLSYVEVPHYSWKYALYNTPTTNWTCPIFATYYFKCKGVR